MSEPATEAPAPEAGAPTADIVELPPMGDAAFGALMDALAPESTEQEGAPVGTEGAPAAGDGASGAPAGEGAPAAGAPAAGTPAEPGAAGAPAAGGDGAAGGPGGTEAAAGAAADGVPTAGADAPAGGVAGPGGDLPADWTADGAVYATKLGGLSTSFEEKVSNGFKRTSFEEVQTEHAAYFEAIKKHPRMLVGTSVPRINGEGTETLRDTDDAKEWQEAVKSLLVNEIEDRAGRAMEENKGFLETVHASIELFQNNIDLIPGTKGFDLELANRFADLAQPYELRVEGKLQGYSIQVQPIIDKLRAQVTAERTAKAAPPSAPAAPAAGVATPPQTPVAPAAPADGPQAGIPAKAGQGDGSEDYSVLFGTIGLPNLQI